MALVFLIFILDLRLALANEQLCERPNNSFALELKGLSGISNQLKAFSEKPKESQFMVACQTQGSTLTAPDVGWLEKDLPLKDSNGNKASDFFKALLKRSAEVSQENVNLSKNIQICMSGYKSDGCDQVRTWVEEDGGLKFKIEEARFHLALAQGPSDIMTVQGSARHTINTQMWTTGLYKEKSWESLKKDEYSQAHEALKAEESDINSDMRRKGVDLSSYNGRRQLNDAIMGVRQNHWTQYKDILETVPFMQFISSRNPSDKEISDAAKKQGDLAAAELDRLSKLAVKIQKGNARDKELLGLLDYKTLVEDVLLTHPEYCGIASSLEVAKEKRGVETSLALAVPVAVAGFVFPISTATVGALATSGVSATMSYADFSDAREKSLSQVVSEKGSAGPDQLDEMKQSTAQSLIVDPVVNVALSGAATSLRLSNIAKAARAGKKAAFMLVPAKARKPIIVNDLPK